MAGEAGPGGSAEGSAERTVPRAVRARLRPWIDLDEVGLAGFWVWLETVLPLLPTGPRPPSGASDGRSAPPDRLRDLAAGLVACAGDRARLAFAGERYFRDNQVLARRVKALEAALRTARGAGGGPPVAEDTDATTAAERYLPRPGPER
jgi:hypothetical protein